jgi:hypothetical protein
MEESKVCKVCGVLKPLSNYHKAKSTKDKKRGECIDCYKAYQYAYNNTQKGTFKRLVASAKFSAEYRKSKGRKEAGIFELTEQDIKQQYDKQNGICYYSGIKMNINNNHWKISLERLDTDKGYTKDNIVLCCFELNSKFQWSEQKIREMIAIIDNPYRKDDYSSDYSFELPKRRDCKSIIKKVVDGEDQYSCTSCDKYFPLTEFRNPKHIRDGCSSCRQERYIRYQSSPRGLLTSFVSTCKTNLKKKKQDRELEFDIDYKYLYDTYRNQKGVCAYSGMPLCFGHDYKTTDWKISIERIDVSKGYIKGNVCFVCLPFNGTDYTCMMKSNTDGNGGWTKEKFQFFLQACRDKYSL